MYATCMWVYMYARICAYLLGRTYVDANTNVYIVRGYYGLGFR